MQFSTRSLFILLSLLLISTNLFSAEDDYMDMSLDELLDLTVETASKSAEKVSDAPSVISVITQKQMIDYGWISINDVLYKQPGFFPSQDFDRRTVGSRGLFEGWNNNHLLMLVDGVPFNDNIYGTAYTWEITPLFITKNIEIMRGPGSALYGSNATNGVVSLNTVDAGDLPSRWNARLMTGEIGTTVIDFVAGNQMNKFDLVAGFNFFVTDGNEYDSFDGRYTDGFADLADNPEQFQVNDNRESSYLFGKISGKEEFEGLELQFHRQNWSFQTGHGWLWHIPDFEESMKESRTILSLSYRNNGESKLSQEYIFRFQRHNIDWNMKYYPDGAYENFYPDGGIEYLNTFADEYFGRVQFSYSLNDNGMSILAGIESTIFSYTGDNEHYSNLDLNDELGGGFAPWPESGFREMGPWFEWVDGKPVVNVAPYLQYSSGGLFDNKLRATLGVRFDNSFINYIDVASEGQPEEDKTFNEVNPRLGIVFKPTENVSIKALGGTAFRAPAPSEMFGYNTFTLASNIAELEPERITTFELALDWKINSYLNLRLNGFYTDFENQIAYSLANNNLSTNIYSLTNAGFEAEVLFSIYGITGFANYSFAQRLDEEIFDQTIEESSDELTWAPPHVFNIGATYSVSKFTISLQGHYQGIVARRGSDYLSDFNIARRGPEVDAWFEVDSRVAYRIQDYIELFIQGTNLLDGENYLIKNFDFPFDYQRLGRRILFGININV